MDTTQGDRDSLRKAQHALHSNPADIIGNLVEHKIQDPAKYKTLSRQEQGLTKDARPPLFKVEYKSKYLSGNRAPKSSQAEPATKSELDDLPIAAKDVQANLWLNMDRFEFEKLEWMSEKAVKEYNERLKLTTHFDSQGKAVQSNSSNQGTQEDIHDIESLVNLLNSTFQPQITYALNVVTKIATRATIGLYDAVFDENIHQVLIKQCLLPVRHHVDSHNETICQSALKCLRALICNTQVDEIFIDKLFPLKSEESDPTIWLMTGQKKFDIDMKDSECVELDAVLALLHRTDILKRFKYLLDLKADPKFKSTYHDCILDLLIRFARYSRGVCWILNSNDFPEILTNLFLPTNILQKNQLEQCNALRAIKFIRLIAQAAIELKEIACQPGQSNLKLIDSIIPVVEAYYYIDFRSYGDGRSDLSDLPFKIHIETLRLMKSLSQLEEFTNHVFTTMSLDLASLNRNLQSFSRLSVSKAVKSPSSLDWQYAAALIDLMGTMMDYERFHTTSSLTVSLWKNYVRCQVMTWFNELLNDRMIPHQDISIALAVAFKQYPRSKDQKSYEDLLALILDRTTNEQDISKNASLAFYKCLARESLVCSQLGTFLKTNGRLRDPVMLPSYGCMDYNISDKYDYKLSGIISLQTPFILLNLYLDALKISGSRFEDLHKHYINSIEMTRYMRSAACYYKYPYGYELAVQQSILAQQEIRLLSNACLFLSDYYFSVTKSEILEVITEDDKEHKIDRNECLSQLMLDAISVIGLINPEVEHMSDLRDGILETIVLSETMHSSLERFHVKSREDPTSGRMDYTERCQAGRNLLEPVYCDISKLSLLKSVYLNCEQPGRYWMFQPFIEYHLNAMEDSKKTEDGQWFARNMNGEMSCHRLSRGCSDADVIGAMLRLNATIMFKSPMYFELAVKPNIEEHLCIVGAIFLNDNLFLDENISKAVRNNIEVLLFEGLKRGVKNLFTDASQKLTTLNLTLMDFFNKLVDQYEAASYNDKTFTNFLLLFMTPKCDKAFRRVLFSDKVETCLSQVSIGHHQVWIPLDLILREKEPDPEIRTLIKLSAPYTTRSPFLSVYRKFHTTQESNGDK